MRSKRTSMKIYLAGPFGFSEAGRHFHAEVVLPAIRQLGHHALDPWMLTEAKMIARVERMAYGEKRRAAWGKLNRKIGATNLRAIEACDAVFAALDGSDVDSGTAAEIGYAFAKGKPILGYRGDFRLSADNEGSTVNLQVEHFIRESGGDIIRTITALEKALKKLVRLRTA